MARAALGPAGRGRTAAVLEQAARVRLNGLGRFRVKAQTCEKTKFTAPV